MPPGPLDEDDILELPEGGDDAKVPPLPKEDGGDDKAQRIAQGKPDGVRGDDLGDDGEELDQLGMARRHNKRLERRFGPLLKQNLDLQNRVRDLEDQQYRLTRSSLHNDLRSARGSVEAVERQLIQARDDGDQVKVIAIERDLATERSRLADLERAVSGVDSHEPAPDRGEATAAEDPRLTSARELADEWSRKHSWYGKPDALEDSEIVRGVSTAIANDPSNPYPIDDPDHFEELDRRLARRLPERYQQQRGPRRRSEDSTMDDDQPDVAGTRGTSRHASPTQPRSNEDLPASLNTQRQINVYKAFGFDYDDPEQQKRIVAQEKMLAEERKDRRHG